VPDDLNPNLLAILADLAGDEAGPEAHGEASPHRRYGASPPEARCEKCDDIPGDGDCPACLAIRAAANQRSRDEQQRYDKAKLTRPINADSMVAWRKRLAGAKGSEMPRTKMVHVPPREIPPARDPGGADGRCPNPRNNPKCRGTAGKRTPLCMSCAMREAHARRRGEATGADVVDRRARQPARALPLLPLAAAAAGPLTIAVADFTIRARIEVHPETGKLEIHGELVER
jgi:hypothetical protein